MLLYVIDLPVFLVTGSVMVIRKVDLVTQSPVVVGKSCILINVEQLQVLFLVPFRPHLSSIPMLMHQDCLHGGGDH